MTLLVTLQVLSNDVLLVEKMKSKTSVLKKLSVYSKFHKFEYPLSTSS